MRLGARGRYAVMAMTDLASRESALGDGRAVALADIAARQEISLSYLEQLFSRLRRRGLVVSARGPGGGYRLATDPARTTLRRVVETVDGSEEMDGCIRGKEAIVGNGNTVCNWLSRSVSGFLLG